MSKPNLPPKQLNLSRQQKGQRGELLAQQLLLNKGYRLLEKNFRTHFGEIDLIFQDKKTIVFVEVKARHYLYQGIPEEAVNAHKLHKITQVGEYYLNSQHLNHFPARIDVVGIEFTTDPPIIRHHINVTA